MKKTIIVFVLAILASLTASAQLAMFEGLEAHGKDAKYIRFDKIIEADDHKSSGKYKLDIYGTSIDTVTAHIEAKFVSNKSGFDINTSKGSVGGATLTGDYIDPIGYPVVLLRHSKERDAVVVIGEYIFRLTGVSKDGTSYKYISRVYMKLDSEEEAKKYAEEGAKAKDEPKKKKKMSLAQRMKASREKMLLKMAGAMGGGSASSLVSSPEYKRASALDMRKMITDYLTKMHAKQAANPQTAKFNALMKEITAYRDKDAADIKAYNDSIKATPEYKKMKAHQKWMENEINVEVKNNSSHTYWVGSSKEAFIITEISAGQSRTMNCTENLYYYSSNTKGSKGTLFHSAKSGCGGSVTLN
jgi:hypothetical protein